MKRVWKYITIFTIIFMSAFVLKVDVNAEKIWNTTGEKDPWGYDYNYKYWDGSSWAYCGDGSPYPELIDISYNVTYDYEEAYKMLEYVNEARREAGVPELIMKDELMDVAMQRAAEAQIYCEHIRPDGSNIQSLSYYIFGENLHMGSNYASKATASLIDSPGHYQTMIDEQYKYVGFGCVDGFWIQIFCVEEVYHENGFDLYNSSNNKPIEWDKMTCYERTNYSEMFTAKVNPKMYDNLSCEIVSSADEYYVGEYIDVRAYLNYTIRQGKKYAPPHTLDKSEYEVSFSGNKLKITDKGIYCADAGTAKVTISLKDYPQFTVTKDITIKTKKGSVVESKGYEYKVTNTSKKNRCVEFTGCDSNVKNVTIPNTVTIGGKKYKVTKIANKAFKGNTNVKKITIGSNVSIIGKEAFANCRNLKKIKVKSTKLKSVGKKALKGINKKAVIKVPKSKVKKYKNLFKGKGQKKSVKVKK